MGSEVKRRLSKYKIWSKGISKCHEEYEGWCKASIASYPKIMKTEQEAFAKAEEHQQKKESINARHAQLMKSTDPQVLIMMLSMEKVLTLRSCSVNLKYICRC